jgi:hypothetical protein
MLYTAFKTAFFNCFHSKGLDATSASQYLGDNYPTVKLREHGIEEIMQELEAFFAEPNFWP